MNKSDTEVEFTIKSRAEMNNSDSLGWTEYQERILGYQSRLDQVEETIIELINDTSYSVDFDFEVINCEKMNNKF